MEIEREQGERETPCKDRKSSGDRWKHQAGMTLVEVMAAGAILLLCSLTAVRGLRISARLMERGRLLQEEGEAAERLSAEEKNRIQTSSGSIFVGDGELPIIIEEYGRGHEPEVTVKIIKPK